MLAYNSKPNCFVPLQDFTSKSDIDWSKTIEEIDLQLYKKYGLDRDEIGLYRKYDKADELEKFFWN